MFKRHAYRVARVGRSATRGAATYRIRVGGTVSPASADDLCGLRVLESNGAATELAGSVADQSALLGVLRQLRDRRHEIVCLCREDECEECRLIKEDMRNGSA